MDKIYSRPRIRIKIPKIKIYRNKMKQNKVKNTKVRKMATLLVILLIAFFTAKFILDAVLPIFDDLCENRAESIATIISNEQASNVMKDYSYDELYTIEKDKDGNITMIKSNVMSINKIVSDVANRIQQEIDNQQKEDVEIAIRKFYRL